MKTTRRKEREIAALAANRFIVGPAPKERVPGRLVKPLGELPETEDDIPHSSVSYARLVKSRNQWRAKAKKYQRALVTIGKITTKAGE